MMPSDRPLVFTVTAIGAQAGHQLGDYLVQTDTCARFKQERSPRGLRALATHVATYALTQTVAKRGSSAAAGLRVPFTAELAGTAAEAVLHAVIDDGRLLAAFARTTAKWGFHQLGAPRQVAAVTEGGQRVRLVPLDEHGEAVVERDGHGRIQDVGPWDNPGPATGRALMDQASHLGLQIPVGAAVTAVVAAWCARRGSRG